MKIGYSLFLGFLLIILMMGSAGYLILSVAHIDVQWHLFGILGLAAVLALVMAVVMARSIARPLGQLNDLARRIGKGHFDARVEVRSCHDEIVRLGEAICAMAEDLRRSVTSVDHLHQQIHEKELIETEKEQINKRLIEVSRRVGKAEVATGIIHNIGNVLNSINLSMSVMRDRLEQSRIRDLKRVIDVVEAHKEDLGAFILNDPKGRVLADYLIQLTRQMDKEWGQVRQEVKALARHIDHVKEIVRRQQDYAGLSGVIEEIAPRELVDEALRIHRPLLDRYQIRVDIDCPKEVLPPLVALDQHKALQILINLVSNACHALKETTRKDRRLGLSVRFSPFKTLVITVSDNGRGILPEHLHKIFSHGFTTKKDGHGFGLHSSALLAREMGGSLSCRSQGPNRGASFRLELPAGTV